MKERQPGSVNRSMSLFKPPKIAMLLAVFSWSPLVDTEPITDAADRLKVDRIGRIIFYFTT